MTDDQEAPRDTAWDNDDSEAQTETGGEWWESGTSDAERERLRQAYDLGRLSMTPEAKGSAITGLQALYDKAAGEERTNKEEWEGARGKEQERLRNAFAAGQAAAYKKLSPNQKAARSGGARKLFEIECVAVAKPPCFLHLPTGDILTDKAFVKKFGVAAGKGSMSKRIARYHALTFQPPKNITDKIRRVVNVTKADDNGLPTKIEYYNAYTPNPLQPLAGTPHVFLNHLRYLIPDQRERKMLGDWLADLVQHPGQKRMFAILLIGPQGTGKSWVADLMRIIVGHWNASQPRNKTLTRDFNGWIANKTLGIIHELKGTGVTAENLQDVITQPTCEINVKQIEAVELPNHISMFLISNHDDCLPMDEQSRRYLVIQCAKVPKDAIDKPSDGPEGRLPYTRTPAMDAYYARLFSESEGQPTEPTNDIYPTPTAEARRTLGWLLRRKIYPENPNALNCRSVAPPTKARGKVVEATRKSLESLITAAFRHRDPPFNEDTFAATDVLPDLDPGHEIEGNERTHAKVTGYLRKLGCEQILGDKSVRTAHGKRTLWALSEADAARLAKLEPRQLGRRYVRARDAASKAEAQAEREESAAMRAEDQAAYEAEHGPDTWAAHMAKAQGQKSPDIS